MKQGLCDLRQELCPWRNEDIVLSLCEGGMMKRKDEILKRKGKIEQKMLSATERKETNTSD